MKLQTQISNEIKKVFEFHEYQINKEKQVELTNLMIRSCPKLNIEQAKEFCMNVNSGIYGTLYKAPSCFMAMFQRYIVELNESNNQPPYYKPLPKL